MVCLEKDKAFENRENAAIRFPLFQAIEKLQNKKTAILKKALAEAIIDPDDPSAVEISEKVNIRLFDALLKYYMHILKPQNLSDEDWAEEIQNLHYIRKTEKEASEPE